jgi:hypothetical protein
MYQWREGPWCTCCYLSLKSAIYECRW